MDADELARQSQQRTSMFRSMGFCVCMDTAFLIIFASISASLLSEVKKCTEDLYWVGITMIIYYAWYVLRNLLVFICCYCCKRPDDTQKFVRLCLFCLDGIALPIILVYATEIIVSKEVHECRAYGEVNSYWQVCMFFLVILYAAATFSVLWCCCCTFTSALVACMLCWIPAA